MQLEGTNLLEYPLCHSTHILRTVQDFFPFIPLTYNITQVRPQLCLKLKLYRNHNADHEFRMLLGSFA